MVVTTKIYQNNTYVKNIAVNTQLSNVGTAAEDPYPNHITLNWNQYLRISLDNVIGRLNHGFNLRNAANNQDDVFTREANLSAMSFNDEIFTATQVSETGNWVVVQPTTANGSVEGTFGTGLLRLRDSELKMQSLFEIEVMPREATTDAAGDNVVVALKHITAPKVVSGNGCAGALKADGSVWAWGGGVNYPTKVDVSNIIDIAAGDSTFFALGSDGTIYGWGLGFNGMSTVTRVPGAVSIVSANAMCYILTEDGSVYTDRKSVV